MISLAYILKNEEAYIMRSIKSVCDAVDEIVVLDMGSEDDTASICEGLGAKVFHHEWKDDFSEARNALLDKCDGDWVLMMDADEHLEGENLDLIRQGVDQAEKNEIAGYQFMRKNHYPSHESDSPYFGAPFFPDFQLRLFRNMEEIYFSGRVHEGVMQSIEAADVGGIGRLPICIHHHMFRGDKEKNESVKGDYYKKLSELES
jgi:glycosyltransferase involved in cell wall biosynthesis